MMIELDVKTHYSVGYAVGSSKRYAKEIADSSSPSFLAITDYETLSGILAHEKACKEFGIDSGFGVQVRVENKGDVVLWADSEDGMFSLYSLSRKMPGQITIEDLAENRKGLVCGLPTLGSLISGWVIREEAKTTPPHLGDLIDIFGVDDLYFMKTYWGIYTQNFVSSMYDQLSKHLGIRTISTSSPHYPNKQDGLCHVFHYANCHNRRCYPDPKKQFVSNAYMRDVACKNALDLAARLSQASVPKFAPLLPKIFDDEAKTLTEMGWAGLDRRFGHVKDRRYEERLEYELGLIKKMNFLGYFLMQQDITNFARSRNIAVGPGRGSGGGSLVAACIGITDLDPMKEDQELHFERFINPERASMPDFDIDFEPKGREEVIEYVRDRFGRDRVMSIMTFGEYKTKEAFKAAGRALGVDYDILNDFSKRTLGGDEMLRDLIKVPSFMQQVERFSARDSNIYDAVMIGSQLEGTIRVTGIHPGGTIILDRPSHHVAPVNTESVCMFSMKDAETVGCVKNDFLGLKELHVIKYALAEVGKDYSFDHFPENDPETLRIYSEDSQLGIFQTSKGMSSFVREFSPQRDTDIPLMLSVYRPGPMDVLMHTECLDRRHGRKEVVYDHENFEKILSNSYGVMVYQEQVMAVCREVAGLTLGQADILRRAIGKKDIELMKKQEEIFMTGGVKRGYDPEMLKGLWEKIDSFGGYGFNLSHAVGYAKISLATAYLKAHHIEAFYAAQCTVRGDSISDLRDFLSEASSKGITIVWPSVNHSPKEFRSAENTIWYGLYAVMGLGESFVDKLIEGRPYTSIFDLYDRLSPDKRQIEALICSSALDEMLWPDGGEISDAERRHVYSIITARAKQFNKLITKEKKKIENNPDQGFLFDVGEPDIFDLKSTNKNWATPNPWSWWELELKRYRCMGSWGDVHPITWVREQFSALYPNHAEPVTIEEAKERVGHRMPILAAVLDVESFDKRRADGTSYTLTRLRLEDETGYVTSIMFNPTSELAFVDKAPAYLWIDSDTWDGEPSFRVQTIEIIHLLSQEAI